MYLILFPNTSMLRTNNNTWEHVFTQDMYRVSQALNQPEVKVFKLDGLTEIKEIEVTFQEIPKEMKDE